jgi:hypothetical protein
LKDCVVEQVVQKLLVVQEAQLQDCVVVQVVQEVQEVDCVVVQVVQEVHVKNRCAWLNHSHQPHVFMDIVARHPNIKLWFSGIHNWGGMEGPQVHVVYGSLRWFQCWPQVRCLWGVAACDGFGAGLKDTAGAGVVWLLAMVLLLVPVFCIAHPALVLLHINFLLTCLLT